MAVLTPHLLPLAFDTDSVGRRTRGLMNLVVQNDLTLALTFGLIFWASAFFLAGAYFFCRLAREAGRRALRRATWALFVSAGNRLPSPRRPSPRCR